MVWINYKKPNNIVSQMECLKIYKISDKVINFITEAMKNWKVELKKGGKTLAEVNIFQGDALSQILFVIAMMSLNYIFRKYTGATNLQNHQKISLTLCTWITSGCLQKMKKNW